MFPWRAWEEMYEAATGEKTLAGFWKESPVSIMYLANKRTRKHKAAVEAQLRAEAEDDE